jgi:hypothetical protein
MSDVLPDPSLTRVYRLEAALGEPLDLGDVSQGRRRIVPLTGGTFAGPELDGKLVAGVSADWQILLPDGTALGDIRLTASRELAWLNKGVFISVGGRHAGGVIYETYLVG